MRWVEWIGAGEMTLTFGSLFSGIGGFDLGMERAGLQAIWQCENNRDCQRVLRRHWPDTRLYNDVKEINRTNTAAPDVIVGGFPCQDLSVAGKRAGLAGERSGLWFEFHRIIKELKPRWAIIENVPGLLSSNSGEDFAVILRGLAECGYHAAWRVLDAQYFGVAQRRRRVFIVASLGNGSCAEILFESEGGAWDSPPGRETGQGFAAAITERTRDAGRQLEMQDDLAYALTNPGSGGRPHSRLIAFGANNFGLQDVSTALSTSSQRIDGDTETFVVNCFNGYTGGADDNDAQGNHLVATVAPTLQKDSYKPGGHLIWEMSHADEAVRINGDTAPTLQQRMGTGGNQVPMVGVRRLTPVECERLQGFPDGWTEGDAQGKTQSDSTRYRQLGNAVAVPVAQWIGQRLAQSPKGT